MSFCEWRVRWMRASRCSVLTHTHTMHILHLYLSGGGAVFADCGLSCCNHIHANTPRVYHIVGTCACTLYALALSGHAGSLSLCGRREISRASPCGPQAQLSRCWSTAAAASRSGANAAVVSSEGIKYVCIVMLVAEFHLRVCAWWLRNRFGGPCETQTRQVQFGSRFLRRRPHFLRPKRDADHSPKNWLGVGFR